MTGEPVTLSGAGSVHLQLRYSLAGVPPRSVTGTGQLVALLSPGGDFAKTVVLGSRVHFSGDTAMLTGSISKAQLRLLATQLASYNASGAAISFTVRPLLNVSVRSSGTVVRRAFDPSVAFSVTPQLLSLSSTSGPATGATSGVSAQLHQTGSFDVAVPARAPATLPLGIVHPQVAGARFLGLLGLVLFGAAAVGLGWPLVLGGDARKRARARYGAIVVPVTQVEIVGKSTVVLGDLESLVMLARRFETIALQVPEGPGTAYLVIDGQTTYRFYEPGTAAQPSLEPEAPALDSEPLRRISLVSAVAAKRRGDGAGLGPVVRS